MFLYRIECQVKGKDLEHVIVLAESDLHAFDCAERLVKQQSLAPVDILETVILEKKPAKLGAGYVILP
jgi:hypothetical protein